MRILDFRFTILDLPVAEFQSLAEGDKETMFCTTFLVLESKIVNRKS